MSESLYYLDCYQKEFKTVVKSVKDDKYVVLDQTAFYPVSGGQPFDTGRLIDEKGNEYPVVFVGKFSGQISHEISKSGLKKGDKVKGIIDWDRRYKHMRMHTAAHVISNIIEKETKALITGNQLSEDKSRIDFSLDEYDRDKFFEYEKKVNELIKEGKEVRLYLLPKEEAIKKAGELTTLAKGFPQHIKEVRLVEIEDFAIEACGGTHVKNISEIGEIKIIKLDNKGKKNRRVYFEIKP
jgi:misacylated tRNA(Ala) deacylase